jgi:hypothetical protein
VRHLGQQRLHEVRADREHHVRLPRQHARRHRITSDRGLSRCAQLPRSARSCGSVQGSGRARERSVRSGPSASRPASRARRRTLSLRPATCRPRRRLPRPGRAPRPTACPQTPSPSSRSRDGHVERGNADPARAAERAAGADPRSAPGPRSAEQRLEPAFGERLRQPPRGSSIPSTSAFGISTA